MTPQIRLNPVELACKVVGWGAYCDCSSQCSNWMSELLNIALRLRFRKCSERGVSPTWKLLPRAKPASFWRDGFDGLNLRVRSRNLRSAFSCFCLAVWTFGRFRQREVAIKCGKRFMGEQLWGVIRRASQSSLAILVISRQCGSRETRQLQLKFDATLFLGMKASCG